mgnify:FL=1
MTEPNNENQNSEENASASELVVAGVTSTWLTENGFDNEALAPDTSNVELIKIEADLLLPIATALYAYG